MSSIRRVENGKVSDEITSAPFMAARELVKAGKAIYADKPTPPKPPVQSDDSKKVADLTTALAVEQAEKVELFDELEKAAKEKADLQKRIAELEASQAAAAKVNTPSSPSTHGNGKTK